MIFVTFVHLYICTSIFLLTYIHISREEKNLGLNFNYNIIYNIIIKNILYIIFNGIFI